MKNKIKNYNWDSYTISHVDDGRLVFSNGAYIEDYHEQDCCERVYADFKALDDYGRNTVFHGEPVIELVEDYGFRVNGAFIPCYNIQSGYYSSNLELRLSWKKDLIDISDCVVDDIY